jgi:cytochrome b561
LSDRPEPHYSTAAIWLHWLVTGLILFMVTLGYYMVTVPTNTPERAFTFNLHKSVGVLTFAIVAVRLFWRWRHPPPPLPAMPAWQVRAAAISHVVLYICMVAQPVTGYLASSFGKYPVLFFGLATPAWGWEDADIRAIFLTSHHTIVVLFLIAIAVHTAAALKHLLIDRNDVFWRMLPPRRR